MKKNKHLNLKRLLLSLLAWSIGSVVLFSTCLYLAVFWGFLGDVPNESKLRAIQNYTATEVYSSDGVLLGKYFLEDRTNVKLSEISPHMIHALIATEDARFYEHKGVDNMSLIRVLVKSILLSNERSGGGSTLSQQTIKNLFPRKNYWLLSMPVNKIREAIGAKKLEQVFSKEEILALYLNTVSFGENAFGVESASRRYFNIHAKQLTIEQASTLVGLLKATNSYNPRKFPEKSKQRRNVVINQMLKYGYLSEIEASKAKSKEIKLQYTPISHSAGLAPYFREHLRLEMQTWCANHLKPDGKPYNLYTDGLKIYTTIDSKLQAYAEEAVSKNMANLQTIFDKHWNYKKPWPEKLKLEEAYLKKINLYKSLLEKGLSHQEILKKLKKKNYTKIFTHQGIKEKELNTLDSLAHYLKFLHAGLVSIESGSGQVKAWVGGINHYFFQYDHVNYEAKRQVGSTFKPIVYASAIENGMEPCTHFENKKIVYSEYNNWAPSNADEQYGGFYSLKGALTHSINTVSAQVIIQSGVDKTVELAKKMGISSTISPIPSIALGTVDASLLEMTNAYATFANLGKHISPNYLLKIEDQQKNLLYKPQKKIAKQVLSSNSAQYINLFLQNVTTQGTAARLKSTYQITRPIAGKTGTTQNNADGWFIAYTPTLVTGVWVGASDPRIHFKSTSLGQGASTALPIWASYFNKLSRNPHFNLYSKSSFSNPDTYAIDCVDFIPPKDSLSFLQKLFGPKPNTPQSKPTPPEVQKRSPKFQDTWHKIRNMFRRNK